MSRAKPVLRGLYAVTPDLDDTASLCRMVEASLRGGAALLQYRNKLADSRLRIAQASALLPLCRQYKVPLIINDDLKLCLALDADGVHLGASDGDLQAARARLAPHQLLGASCYDQLELANSAAGAGVDYIAFGACFSSGTKPQAVQASLTLFQTARQAGLPDSVAIGGISLENAAQAIAAGASAIAVIGALWNSADIEHTARQFHQLFTHRAS
ncbi:thiamine phosphate synthase [Pseudomethylobacillus aquaticus]|uniref:Thiamine-phosphate synthase n=1 Tax=Pseudomethylobacillus aquaticus TaxID=2676064 RepID=A0A3N0V2D8_9PROT|nr:thiamine phosphate synthase [Pseudomethylobacillus aquaticus]ROH86883.1 thiamine phosphate synthase [Pseudomethylobacillus aquaticus]